MFRDAHEPDTAVRLAAVDGDPIALEALVHTLRKAMPTAEVDGYHTGSDALKEMNHHRYDAVFTEVELSDIDASTFARKLQERSTRMNIVYVTRHRSFMAEALQFHCSGYVLKPVSLDKVSHELENLRFPVGRLQPGLYMQCFGRFEAYWNGVPLRFKRLKSKELLAYLVSQRGAMCSVYEVEAALWEHAGMRSHQSHLRHLVADLRATLKELGAGDMLLQSRGLLGVDPKRFTCDYYDYLDEAAKPPAPAFFMEQYSWTEQAKATLQRGGSTAV